MRRRDFISHLGCMATTLLAPSVVAAQQTSGRVRTVGTLIGLAADDPEGQARLQAFRQSLSASGWVEGKTLRIEVRWVRGADTGLLRAGAAELVRLSPDVIMVNGARAAAAVRQYTRSIPTVFALIDDPVRQGVVESLARPGGHITGFSQYKFMSDKMLEILKEIAPSIDRVALAHAPTLVGSEEAFRNLRAAAPKFGVEAMALAIRERADIAPAFESFAHEGTGGVIVMGDATLVTHRQAVIAAMARHRLPAIYPEQRFVREGGLIAYGVDRLDQYRLAASYVDRILRGESPANLPVQLPTKFGLLVNFKTAQALGLDVPNALLVRADEVIE